LVYLYLQQNIYRINIRSTQRTVFAMSMFNEAIEV